jgi:sulfur relay (sulfurtransferase) complex TusBCD TusD component (DsrE family)
MNQRLQQLSMHMAHAIHKKHERRDIFISQKAIENQNSHTRPKKYTSQKLQDGSF